MNPSALALPSNRLQKAIGNAYLKFHVDRQITAMLPMKQVQEVLALPTHRLTSMPNMPACVLGLMNRRSQVLWLVDLKELLGISPSESNVRQYNLIIVRVGTVALGLAVQSVEGMIWLEPDSVKAPPGQLPPELTSYLDGCVLQEQSILWVLSADSILRSPIFHNL